MENKDFEIWKKSVDEHRRRLSELNKDEDAIRNWMEDYLKQFFTWSEIEFSEDFSKITLEYERYVGAVIKTEKIAELCMDWIVSDNYRDSIKIELYPFGLPEDGEIVWD